MGTIDRQTADTLFEISKRFACEDTPEVKQMILDINAQVPEAAKGLHEEKMCIRDSYLTIPQSLQPCLVKPSEQIMKAAALLPRNLLNTPTKNPSLKIPDSPLARCREDVYKRQL